MKTILLIPVLLLTTIATYAQSLRKYPIGNSGCSVYTFCDPAFSKELSEDSSAVYSGDCSSGDITYGVICVTLQIPLPGLDDAENLMINYVDYLKPKMGITKSVGYGKGHRLNNMENTRGVLDYCEDKEKNQWKLKAWTDGKYIGVLYAYSKAELPEPKVKVFLDSFRMPE